MEKKLWIISSAYARKDVDGTVLGFTVGVKEANSNSEYVYRFDFGPASFTKVFGFDWIKEENRLVWLQWSKVYITRSLTLS